MAHGRFLHMICRCFFNILSIRVLERDVYTLFALVHVEIHALLEYLTVCTFWHTAAPVSFLWLVLDQVNTIFRACATATTTGSHTLLSEHNTISLHGFRDHRTTFFVKLPSHLEHEHQKFELSSVH